ncbi:MAG TPA: IclR family transcriptional regulator [Solirubrobacteraceae bacterium]|nr:IclR family transcriptional regulator [Solirubrobacteraceae bacterium]
MATDRATHDSAQGVKSVEVGARVLFALEQGRGPMPLSEVARRSDMHPAKAHRYLTSLVRAGLASQSVSSGLYDLGPAAQHLGVEALRRTDAVSAVSAYAAELRDQTGHTVHVSVWGEHGPTIVRWDTGTHLLPIVIRVGSVLPLLDSAVGQVFLTHLPASTTAAVLKNQQRQGMTRRVPAKDVTELKDRVRRDGLARTRNQMIFGLAALAAAVFGAGGDIEVVLGLSLPAQTVAGSEAKSLGSALRDAADRCSHQLGFSGAASPDRGATTGLRRRA